MNKKLSFFTIGLLLGLISFSQSVVQRSAAVITVEDWRLMAGYNFFLPRYGDTTAANVQKGIDSSGAIVYTYDDKIWFRTHAKKWKEVGADLSSNYWGILGNSGTVDGVNFLGTTDNIPFNIRANNQKAGRIEISSSTANTFYGYLTGNSNSTGTYNTANGYRAFINNTSGGFNTVMGYQSLFSNLTGVYNTSIGVQSLYSNTSGGFNTGLGVLALYNSTGSFNSSFGYHAIINNTTGNYNTGIGYNANVRLGNLTNATAIGANSIVAVSNAISFGDSALNTMSGFGTSFPTNIVDIQGTDPLRLRTLSSGSNTDSIMTIDGSGVVKKRNISSIAERFGVSGEDDVANEDRGFDANNFYFSINNAKTFGVSTYFNNNSIFLSDDDGFVVSTSNSGLKYKGSALTLTSGETGNHKIILDCGDMTADGVIAIPTVSGGSQILPLSVNGHFAGGIDGNIVVPVGTGTVTSVATGYGLSGGTITTSGTLLVDSATLKNYFRRNKDSVAGGYYPYSSNPLGYLTGNQSITLSGDVSGSGTTAITTTLATVNSNVGTFGTVDSVPVITVNAKGLTTAASKTKIQIAESQVTNLTTDLAALVPTSRTISTTAPITGGGDLSANRTFAIAASTNSVDGYLTAADHTTFAAKQSALTGTKNYIPYFGSNNVINSVSTFNRDSATGFVGIGTATPAYQLHVKGTDNVCMFEGYSTSPGTVPGILCRRGDGTVASPVGVSNGYAIGGFFGAGMTNTLAFTGFSSTLKFFAAETYTSSAQGSYMTFELTPIGSTTRAEYARMLGNGALGLGTTAPAASSLFDVTSTTKGILIPRQTTTQVNAISSPAKGLLVFDTTLGVPKWSLGTGTGNFNRSVITNDATPSNGQIPIGNGTNYTVATPTGTQGVSVTTGSGTLAIGLGAISPVNYYSTSATPAIVAGAGAGTSPTVSIVGTNSGGIITITTGTLPTLSAVAATITFSSSFAFPNGCAVVVSPHNANAAILSGAQMVYLIGATTNWTVNTGTTALTAITTYEFNYKVEGY